MSASRLLATFSRQSLRSPVAARRFAPISCQNVCCRQILVASLLENNTDKTNPQALSRGFATAVENKVAKFPGKKGADVCISSYASTASGGFR